MNKLKQIKALVEEAMTELVSNPRRTSRETLTDLAKKSAQMDYDDFWDSDNNVDTYNTRLRGEVKEELHPAIQHVNAEGELSPKTVKAINKLAEVAYNTPIKPALQPLPEKMPEWFMDQFLQQHALENWNKVIQHFGTQPREWWKDLKREDKFMCGDGVRTFSGKYSCIDGNYFLYTIEEGDIGLHFGYCSPYTDPEAEFIATLTPEQLAMYKHVKEGKG